ncbi:uncharacterized protein LOC135477473 [Liolophura sinensis]|uniref:uncharacterized protein LOC135477473 n=1 Tax=Liolophura sinensis TaxID=3198878 RepID=UPI0031586CFF
MASTSKKAKISPVDGHLDTSDSDSDSDLPECPYGERCYRKNPQHFKEFSHPAKHAKDGTTTTTGAAVLPSKINSTADNLPPCKYGANCYRKNLIHFAEYSHPTNTDKATTDSGNDTDVYDSDDGDEGMNGKGVLIKGDSQLLVKSYSKMTEDERKELIKKAFEAKKQLQEELRQTKEQMAEKEKELKKLQDQVTTGLLLVDGEKEALEGTVTKYFVLHAERAYKEGSADQIHFRLAESQFYRLLSGQYCQQYQSHKVEYVVNPTLLRNFSEAREDLKRERGEKLSYPVLAFHGTSQQVIPKICEGIYEVPGEKGFKHKTDTGWYGKGVYFSEYPGYSMGYIQGATSLLLCQVLPGKVYQCTQLIHGASLTAGYDSHISPCKKELVVFNSHHILPSYIVHYASVKTEFKYSKTVTGKLMISDEELKKKYVKACKAAVKKGAGLFSNTEFQFSGQLIASHKELGDLIVKHGGKIGSSKMFDRLISTPEEVEKGTAKVKKAQSLGPDTILSQAYIFDMILTKGKAIKDIESYHL